MSDDGRLMLKLQQHLFTVLVLVLAGVLAALSLRHHARFDLTAGQRNSLTEASVQLMQRLDQAPGFTVFVRDPELRAMAEVLLERYRDARPDIEVEFVNPDQEPERTRVAGVRADGETLVRYGGDQRLVPALAEDEISNALQSLARGQGRFLVFTTGHGERDPYGQAGHELGALTAELQRKGLRVQQLNLTEVTSVPGNAALLVLASPTTELFPHEMAVIDGWLRDGGNLLLLTDPGGPALLALARSLGVELGDGEARGQLVDSTAQLLGLDDPTAILAGSYDNAQPITSGFELVTLFPGAVSVQAVTQDAAVSSSELVTSQPSAWLELGPIRGALTIDHELGDLAGPLPLLVALERQRVAAPPSAAADAGPPAEPELQQQRIVVAGDGDFLSNAFLGSGGNLQLATGVFEWLAGEDEMLDIVVRSAPDRQLQLSDTQYFVLSVTALFLLPLALIAGGVVTWVRRRRR